MMFQYVIFSAVFASLCSFNVGLSTRRKGRVTNVETLREAVNSAFDALTEVHEAIAKLDDGSNDDSESSYKGDLTMDKDTAEKFVEEIDQLEDMIINKKNVKDFVEKKKETKKDENGSKAVQLPSKRAETHTMDSIGSDGFKDEDIEQSVDFLLDFLKDGAQHEKRDSKLKDFLVSVFEKETRELKKGNEAMSSLVSGMEKKSKNKKQKDEVKDAISITKSNANLSVKEIKDDKKAIKKEIEKSEEVLRSSDVKSDTKSESAKKETETDKKYSSKVADTQLSGNESGEKTKKHVEEAVEKHSSTGRGFDNEIRDLVDVILKRKEKLKREKLKLAVADMFQIMESKDEVYKQRNDEAGKEMRKYERMLMEN